MRNYFRLLSIIIAMAILGVFVVLAPWFITQRNGEIAAASLLYKLSQISPAAIIKVYFGFVAILSALSFWFGGNR